MAPPDAQTPTSGMSQSNTVSSDDSASTSMDDTRRESPSDTPTKSPSETVASSPDHVQMKMFPAMIYTYTINHADGSSNFPYVSEYCETIFGFDASYLMTHPELLMNSVHSDDSEKFTKSVVESMQNMTIWNHRFRMLDKFGNVKWVHGKSQPEVITNDETTWTKWSGVLFDITEHEEYNQLDRAEMRSLMNESVAPIFGIDCTGVVYKWNEMMGKLSGYSSDEAIGKSLVSFMSEQERGSIIRLLGSIQRTGRKLSGETEQECCLLTKNEHTPLHLYLKPVTRHDNNGDITGVAFVGQDITKVKEEEKKKEAALKLVDAEKGLTEWLSHEVRNPLSIATEAAEALKENQAVSLDTESASHVDLISQSLSYIVDLLTDMLDLNKCIEGKVILDNKECNVREEVLVPTRDMMNVRSKSVQVVVEGGEGIVAKVDSLRLRQVVTNLVSNSLKFTTVGFVKISLRYSSEDDGSGRNDTVLLKVSDSGCGISKEHHANLFTKWEQLGSRVNGTGIGLCLCQALIRLMGGHISLNQDYDSGLEGHPGAEFVIELPVCSFVEEDSREKSVSVNTFDAVSRAVVAARTGSDRHNDQPGIDTSRRKDSKTIQTTNGSCCVSGKYHILIVDDDKVGRKFIRRRFQRLFPDAILEEAVSGEEAVEMTKERIDPYDIITMDHFMGINDMNGAETIQALRDAKVDALIIGISGNAKGKEHLSAGAEGFLQKPIPPDEAILDMILALLAPPHCWKVLIVDDVQMNNHFLARKLRKLSSPHFTEMSIAAKRWNITSATSSSEAIDLLRSKSFDLIVLDHQLGEEMNGIDIGRFVREKHGNSKDVIIVLNSGSIDLFEERDDIVGDDGPFNLFWPKPLPDSSKMRLDLCCELLSRQRPDSISRQQSSTLSK